MWLLAMLVLVPFALVCIPAVLVFQWSDRGWTFASHARPRGEPDVSALRGSLERTAQKDLPAPAPLDNETIELRSTPDRVAARVEKVTRTAQDLGGSAVEGLPAEGLKHLYVELPAGRSAAFRELIKSTSATPPPMPAANASAGKEHVEVIIHTGDE